MEAAAPTRLLHLDARVMGPDRREIATLMRRTVDLAPGASVAHTLTWAAPEGAQSQHYLLVDLRDPDTGALVNRAVQRVTLP